MIPKSALSALTGLLAQWRNGPEGLNPGERTIYVDYRRACADDLALVLQSLEPTEARAVEVLPCLHLNTVAFTHQGIDWCGDCGAIRCIGWCDGKWKSHNASPLPKAETQPVAWRAWSKPVPGRKWPSDQWVYWDEEPTTIQDDPEFSQFQALYTHPSPQPEAATIDAAQSIRELLIAAEQHHRLLANTAHKKDAGITFDKHALVADTLEEILAASSKHTSEHAGKQGWQPIETAPKDGKRVLLYWGGEVISGFYLDNSKTAVPWEGWSTGSGVPAKLGKPTHWHPYAAAPQAAEEK